MQLEGINNERTTAGAEPRFNRFQGGEALQQGKAVNDLTPKRLTLPNCCEEEDKQSAN